jgi:hypothetical protein
MVVKGGGGPGEAEEDDARYHEEQLYSFTWLRDEGAGGKVN